MFCFFNQATIFIFLFWSCFGHAQTAAIDSLLSVLQTHNLHDTAKCSSLNSLAWQLTQAGDGSNAMKYVMEAKTLAEKSIYGKEGKIKYVLLNEIASSNNIIGLIHKYKGDFDKALSYYLKSLKYSEEISSSAFSDLANDAKKSIAMCSNNIGLVYYNKGNHSSAKEYFLKALKIYEEKNDDIGQSHCFINLGNIYDSESSYDTALEYFFKALKICANAADTTDIIIAKSAKKGMSMAYNNIGNIYMSKNESDDAIEFYKKSLAIDEQFGNKPGASRSLNNIGTVYSGKGDESRNVSDYDTALSYYLKSLKIKEETGDKKGIGTSYENIGLVYSNKGEILNNPEFFSEAKKYLFKSLELRENIGDKNGTAGSLSAIGDLLVKQKKCDEARPYFLSSLEIYRQTGNLYDVMNIHLHLSECDSLRGNFKDAYNHHRMYSQIKDSIFNVESAEKTAQMKALYESEKKQKEIELLQKDKEIQSAESKKQKLVLWFVAGSLLLVILFAGFIVNRWRITQRQKSIIQRQKSLVDEKNSELAEKNKDITDSIRYARRIQDAILPFEGRIRAGLNAQDGKRNMDFFILYKPKDIVSGDFYWFLEKNGKAVIAVADCTGHGVPGAFMSMIGNDLLNDIVGARGITQADLILNELHSGIRHALKQDETHSRDGMDIAIAVLDVKNNKLNYSGAKNPLVYISENRTNIIKADKQPIGGLIENGEENRKFTLHEIDIVSPFSFYLFSDGYQDQFGGGKGKKLMFKNFRQMLSDIQYLPMPEQKKYLDNAIEQWKNKQTQVDDICVIGVRI